MKLSVEEIEDIIQCIDLAQEIDYSNKTNNLRIKLESKLLEIKGEDSRLLSNSELKSIGF